MQNVLIVDNDSESLEVYKQAFDNGDIRMVVAEDPLEALERVKQKECDLVITELCLPEMTGSDFVEGVRAINSEIPIIVVSAPPKNARERFFCGKISSFLQKPFSLASLKATLSEVHSYTTEVDESLEEASVGDEITNYQQRFRILLEIAMALGCETELDKIMALVTGIITKAIGAERATAFMIDEETQEIWSVAGIGLEAQEIRLPRGAGIVGKVAETGEVVLTNDPYSYPDFNSQIDKETGFRTRSILTIPMRNTSGTIFGVFQVLNKENKAGFTSMDKELLFGIAGISSIWFQNGLLAQELDREKQMSMLGHLAGGVTHEIQNLLAPLSFAELIARKYPDDEQIQKYTSFISNAREHAVSILEEVHEMSNPSTSFEVVPERLEDLINQVIRFLQVDPVVKDHPIELDVETNTSPVPLNTSKFKQVLIHLIRNACLATPDPEAGKVSIGLSENQEGIQIYIKDNGKGIPEKAMETIWQRYFSTKEKQGSGLGLDVCKKIIEMHGGTITCQSELGKGSTFTIHFSPEVYSLEVEEEDIL